METLASAFKKSLRLHTRHAGFGSLRDLEERTGLAHTTISHAFNLGRDLPSERTVYVIIQATKGDQQFWGSRLQNAMAEEAVATIELSDNDGAPLVDAKPALTVPSNDGAPHGQPVSGYIARAAVGLFALSLVLLVVISSDDRGQVKSAGENETISSATPSGIIEDDELFDETAIPDNSVRTIGDPFTGGGLGVYIEPSQTVQVSCRVYSAIIPSALPDGYFYRIESSPWNGNFYASANSFLNGDPPGDPTLYVTPTDLAVPLCGSNG